MKHITRIKTLLAGAAMLGLAAGASAPAEAAFIFNMVETGGNVEVTGSGSFNLSALTVIGQNAGAVSGISSSIGYLVTGRAGLVLNGLVGPSNFGAGPLSEVIEASSRTGDPVGIVAAGNQLGLSGDYVSGTSLSTSMSFEGATFASLSAIPGTYVWTWGSGATADSLTLNIGQPTAVPEPASLALFGAGLIGLAALRRRKPPAA